MMNALTLMILVIAISLTVSMAVILLISRSLKAAVHDLCPNDAQAGFWLAYTRIMLLVAPLLPVLLANSVSNGDLLNALRSALIAALGGILFGLIILGKKMYIPVERQLNSPVKDNQA